MGNKEEGQYVPETEERKAIEWADPFQTVLVDVDSCLAGIEGIDLLADMHGKKQEVEGLTAAAMNGEIPFDKVFGKRLDIIQPQNRDMEVVAARYIQTLTPDAFEVIHTLQEHGIDVWLVSGGYDEAIYPLARHLGIPQTRVYANHLFFDAQGNYAGLDAQNPLSGKSGKLALIENLRVKREISGKFGIVGDGASEVETHPVVDLCVGFGGHVARERVMNEADVFIEEKTFAALLPLLLGRRGVEECIRYYPHARQLMRTGLDNLARALFQRRALGWDKDVALWRGGVDDTVFDPEYPVPPVWNRK